MAQLPLFQSLSLTVTELTYYLRQLFEADEVLQNVWVSGEISNLSKPRSGHIYFTLKDENASLHCVIWKSTAFKIKNILQDGMAVEVHGSVSIYERSGQYQLYVSSLRMAGEGLLYQEFVRLKKMLEAEGLFDEERKRPVPRFPHRIGVVTSPTGAALQDILNTIRSRFPLAEVILSPTAVQGDAAPLQIIQALRDVNIKAQPDVILLCRGGGSLEDLWAFNNEDVVRAVVASESPVITGIGHETDFSLADFAADLRAPTPTAAAVMATPEIGEIWQSLNDANAALDGTMQDLLQDKRNDMDSLDLFLKRLSPQRRIQNDGQRLDEIDLRINRAAVRFMQYEHTRLDGFNNRLKNLSPSAVLKRGYAIVSKLDGQLVKSITDTQTGEQLDILLKDGKISSTVNEVCEEK